MANKIYCARDIRTGKLVSNLTNPKKKFWQRKSAVEDAIKHPNRRQFNGDTSDLEVVEYDLVEVNSWKVLKKEKER